jgi:LmbE family N-acetylglucosaminyl deacetylase
MRSGRVLVFAPHPDDEVLGCGGAIQAHVAAGDPVAVIVVTDGGRIGGGDRAAYVARRRDECSRAAVVLGYGAPIFWDYVDGELSASEGLADRLRAAIDEQAATLVYGPSVHERHPDHRALAVALVAVLRSAHHDFQLAMYEVGALSYPSLLLDISARWADKRAALSCFGSQLEQERYDEQMESLNRYRTSGLPPRCRAVEAFRVVSRADLDAGHLALSSGPHPVAPAARDLAAMLVSVVVIARGHGELDATLASVACQTYPNIEVVLVLASGATGLGLPTSCGRFPLRAIDAGELGETGAPENQGLAAVHGGFVALVDDAVQWRPEHVEELVQALQAAPAARLAHHGIEVRGRTAVATVFDQPFQRGRLLYGEHVPLPGVLFARSLCEEGCRFDASLGPVGGRDFLLQASARTAFLHVPGVSGVWDRLEAENTAVRRAAEEALVRKWTTSPANSGT